MNGAIINLRSVVYFAGWLFVALFTFMSVHCWYITLRTFGLSSLRISPRIIRLALRAKPIRELTAVLLVTLIALLLLNTYWGESWFAEVLPSNVILVIILMTVVLYLVPPAALVLTSSTDRQLRWALTLKGLTGGYRVISMLDTGYMTTKADIGDAWAVVSRRSLTLMDVLRTSDSDNWQNIVKELIAIAPIVIMDTRESTQAVLFETGLMLSPEYSHKVIFVSKDDGTCPAFEKLVGDSATSQDILVSVVKEEQVGQLLKERLKKVDLPVKSRFMSTPKPISEIVGPQLLRAQDKERAAGLTGQV